MNHEAEALKAQVTKLAFAVKLLAQERHDARRAEGEVNHTGPWSTCDDAVCQTAREASKP